MDMVTLVADMSDLYMLVLKVPGHFHRLYDVLGPCLDGLVVTTQAQGFYFLTLFDWQPTGKFAILDMVGIGAMTEFAGNGLVASLFVEFPFEGMAGQARFVGHVPQRPVHFILNGVRPVVTILAERSRRGKFLGEESKYGSHHQ